MREQVNRLSNPFWTYSCDVYRREGVAQHCLALQDEHGVDVNVLLYGAWLGSAGRQLVPGHLRELEFLIAPWRSGVVQPLRQLRRSLQSRPGAYADVKALELTAEHQQQNMMYRFYQENPLKVAGQALPDNLDLVVGLQDARHEASTKDRNQRVADLSQLLIPAGVASRQGR